MTLCLWFSAGNLHHLLVESCIARNLLDQTACLWPGFVNGRISQMPLGEPAQKPGWSSFMKGAPLSPGMIHALISNPASRYDRLHEFVLG